MAVIINGELVETLSLPDQTGHAGQPLVTNGVTADWTAIAGTGDMAKSTYDTNNNGIVDRAAVVDDGAGNNKSAAQIRSHIDSTSNPHNVTAAQVGAAATPSGTGMVHVTAGVQDAASKLIANVDVDAAAAIVESKLSLNNPTHSNVNDPSSDQKNALVGTNGTPYSGNRYVTDSDPRNTNARTPSAHGSAQHTGTIGTPTQVGLNNVPNVDATNATNITSGTLPAARLPAMSAGAKGGVPATGAPSGKYLKDDGTWDSPAGAGDMAKATYDTTNAGIVDKAQTVDDGAGNSATAAAIKTALTATIPGKADLVAGATNGHLAGLDAGGNLTDSGNEPADFAPAAKGVTDGDSHDHTGGSGAAITEAALSLSNITTGDVDNTKHGFCPITPNDTDKYLRGDATWAIPPSGGSPPSGTGWRHVTAGVEDGAASTPSKTDVGLGNVANLDQTNPANITQDATHRFATDAEKSAWNAKLDPAGSGANLTGIPEGALSFTNITTNDLSTTKHGLAPRAPNDVTKFLRGDASWAVPSAGSASWPLVTSKSEISPGDTGYATLDAILAGPPAAGTSILVQSGTHTLTNDRTLPAGVHLRVLPGANIIIPATKTFTINGHIDAGSYQIFTDNSAAADKGVKFTYSEMVYPEWWGADPTGAVTSHTAFQLASQSFLYGGVILCTNNYYKFTSKATLNAGTVVQGIAPISASFLNKGMPEIQASTDTPIFDLNNDCVLLGMSFLATVLDNAPAMIYSTTADIRRVTIDNCFFQGNMNSPFTSCLSFPLGIHDSRFTNNRTYETYTFLSGQTPDCIIGPNNQINGAYPLGAGQVWATNRSQVTGDYCRPTISKMADRADIPWMFWTKTTSGTTHAATEPTWPVWTDAIYLHTANMTASGSTFTLSAGSWPAAYNDSAVWIYMHGGLNNGYHHIVSASGANLVVAEALNAEASPVAYTVCPTVLDNDIRWIAVPPCYGLNVDGFCKINGNYFQYNWAGIMPSGSLSGIINANTFVQNLGYGVYSQHETGLIVDNAFVGNTLVGSSNVGIDGWWTDAADTVVISGNTFVEHLGYGLNIPPTNTNLEQGHNAYRSNTAGNVNTS